ncbi:MFS transporter [Pseudonocardia sp. MCCB 268]|nr:MFS transporter [Pseudonocardia cytotoxica]
MTGSAASPPCGDPKLDDGRATLAIGLLPTYDTAARWALVL